MNIIWFRLFAVAVMAILCFVGCDSPRGALSNYHMVQLISIVPKAVTDDVQSYIHSAGLSTADISSTEYMEDGAGGHAVVITQELPKSQGHELKSHVLIYDKINVRKKVKVYSGHRSC